MKSQVQVLTWLISSFFLAIPAQAANHYVRATANGTGSGSDWINACRDFTGSCAMSALVRGDTYYVAGGSYGTETFSKPASGTSVITIKGAIASDHGTDVGWVATYGVDVNTAVFRRAEFASSYWIFNGQVGGGPGRWKTGYGFKVDRSGTSDEGPLIDVNDGADSITVAHVELLGHGADGASYTQDGINSGNGNGPRTFSYIYIHEMGRCPLFNRAHNTTWEFLYTGYYESTPAQHSELASFWIVVDGTVPIRNTTFRWSVLTHFEGTGGFIVDADGMYVYGNVFYTRAGDACASSGNGLIGAWTNDVWKGIKIYNNTFLDVNCPALATVPVTGSTAELKNNLFWQSDVNLANMTLWDHNTYNSTSLTGTRNSTDVVGTANTVPNYLSDDFRLTSATAAGATLGAPYNIDMYGNTRGADGTWDRGAVEFGGLGGGAPSAPTSLRIIP